MPIQLDSLSDKYYYDFTLRYLSDQSTQETIADTVRLIIFYLRFFLSLMSLAEGISLPSKQFLSGDLFAYIHLFAYIQRQTNAIKLQALKILFLASHFNDFPEPLTPHQRGELRKFIFNECNLIQPNGTKELFLLTNNKPKISDTNKALISGIFRAIAQENHVTAKKYLPRLQDVDEIDKTSGMSVLHYALRDGRDGSAIIAIALLKTANANPCLLTEKNEPGPQQELSVESGMNALQVFIKYEKMSTDYLAKVRQELINQYISAILPLSWRQELDKSLFVGMSSGGQLQFFNTSLEANIFGDISLALNLQHHDNPELKHSLPLLYELATVYFLARFKEHNLIQYFLHHVGDIKILSFSHKYGFEIVALLKYFSTNVVTNNIHITFVYSSEDNNEENFENLKNTFNTFPNVRIHKAHGSEIMALIASKQLQPEYYDLMLIRNISISTEPLHAYPLLTKIMPLLIKPNTGVVYVSFINTNELRLARQLFYLNQGEHGQTEPNGQELSYSKTFTSESTTLDGSLENFTPYDPFSFMFQFSKAKFNILSDVRKKIVFNRLQEYKKALSEGGEKSNFMLFENFVRSATNIVNQNDLNTIISLVVYYSGSFVTQLRLRTATAETKPYYISQIAVYDELMALTNATTVSLPLALELVIALSHQDDPLVDLDDLERKWLRNQIWTELAKLQYNQKSVLKAKTFPYNKTSDSPTTNYTPAMLRQAAHEGDIDQVKACINAGVPLNIPTDNSLQLSALHLAMACTRPEHLAIINLLLKAGANPCLLARKQPNDAYPIHTPVNLFVEKSAEIKQKFGEELYEKIYCKLLTSYITTTLTPELLAKLGSKIFFGAADDGEVRFFNDRESSLRFNCKKDFSIEEFYNLRPSA